jgi:ribonucleoside-diphosphate reductase alpha chain
MNDMFNYKRNGQYAPLLSEEVHKVIMDNAEFLDSHIIYRDFNYDYFGFKTLERSYLLKINGKIVERPQR